ncbi:MAG: hypothetical protein Q4D57_03295 [Clostridia bacterium]|nr:hypothetical protein [Clostridia bacterium]
MFMSKVEPLKRFKSAAEIRKAMKLAFSSTKALVEAGMNGYDKDKYNTKGGFPNLLATYNWMATRDYNLVLIFLAICSYAASKSDEVKTYLNSYVKRTDKNAFLDMIKPQVSGKKKKYVVNTTKVGTDLKAEDGVLKKVLDAIYDGFTYNPKAKKGVEEKPEDIKKRNEKMIGWLLEEIPKRMKKITNWIINGPDVLRAYMFVCEKWGVRIDPETAEALEEQIDPPADGPGNAGNTGETGNTGGTDGPVAPPPPGNPPPPPPPPPGAPGTPPPPPPKVPGGVMQNQREGGKGDLLSDIQKGKKLNPKKSVGSFKIGEREVNLYGVQLDNGRLPKGVITEEVLKAISEKHDKIVEIDIETKSPKGQGFTILPEGIDDADDINLCVAAKFDKDDTKLIIYVGEPKGPAGPRALQKQTERILEKLKKSPAELADELKKAEEARKKAEEENKKKAEEAAKRAKEAKEKAEKEKQAKEKQNKTHDRVLAAIRKLKLEGKEKYSESLGQITTEGKRKTGITTLANSVFKKAADVVTNAFGSKKALFKSADDAKKLREVLDISTTQMDSDELVKKMTTRMYDTPKTVLVGQKDNIDHLLGVLSDECTKNPIVQNLAAYLAILLELAQ